jgi:hypothetical protein
MHVVVRNGPLTTKCDLKRLPGCVLAITAVLLAGCGSSRESAPNGLSSSALLQRDLDDKSRWAYQSPVVDIAAYDRFHFESVAVLPGPEAEFGSMSSGDRQALAAIIGEEFASVFGEKYSIAFAPGPGVARVRLTLLGVKRTIGGLATVTRVLPHGIMMNAAKGAMGGSGTFTGSIELAIEIFDSQKDSLFRSEIRRETPAVYDIEATLSTDRTVRSAARALAKSVREDFDKQREKRGTLQR